MMFSIFSHNSRAYFMQLTANTFLEYNDDLPPKTWDHESTQIQDRISPHSLKRSLFSYGTHWKEFLHATHLPYLGLSFTFIVLNLKWVKHAKLLHVFDAFASVIFQKCFLLKSVYSQVWVKSGTTLEQFGHCFINFGPCNLGTQIKTL